MPDATPLTIIAIATAASGKESALREVQKALVADTVKEAGCLRYELHQSLEDGRVLIFVERWASEAQWRAHMEGSAMKRFQASGAGRLIQGFALHRMTLVADGQ